ncbi:MAG: hypothetical protein IKN72_03820 [Clostridia bacterium]|nr:hypothetical protein [Clostridia bacterium]
MARYEHGVTDYAVGYATIKVAFPNSDVCCNNCEFCFKEHSMDRCRCRLRHDEIIPSEAVKIGVLPGCPIEFLKPLKGG